MVLHLGVYHGHGRTQEAILRARLAYGHTGGMSAVPLLYVCWLISLDVGLTVLIVSRHTSFCSSLLFSQPAISSISSAACARLYRRRHRVAAGKLHAAGYPE